MTDPAALTGKDCPCLTTGGRSPAVSLPVPPSTCMQLHPFPAPPGMQPLILSGDAAPALTLQPQLQHFHPVTALHGPSWKLANVDFSPRTVCAFNITPPQDSPCSCPALSRHDHNPCAHCFFCPPRPEAPPHRQAGQWDTQRALVQVPAARGKMSGAFPMRGKHGVWAKMGIKRGLAVLYLV